MKRIIIYLICLIIPIFPILAYTDSFNVMNSDEDFLALLDVIKNGGDKTEAEEAYAKYINKDVSNVEKSRAEYHMVRYYTDMGNKRDAQIHLDREKEYYDAIPDSASELEKRVAQADFVGAEYYLTGKLGLGMENSKLTKNLYKDFPNEFYPALQEAFRLLYTPPIAGGSTKKALRIINDMESSLSGISRLDYYSFLVAKAMALSKSDKWDESDACLDEAEKIYSFDIAVDDIRKDNKRGR